MDVTCGNEGYPYLVKVAFFRLSFFEENKAPNFFKILSICTCKVEKIGKFSLPILKFFIIGDEIILKNDFYFDFQRIPSNSFRETDKFRLYRLLSRDHGRNRKIGPDQALDYSSSVAISCKKSF